MFNYLRFNFLKFQLLGRWCCGTAKSEKNEDWKNKTSKQVRPFLCCGFMFSSLIWDVRRVRLNEVTLIRQGSFLGSFTSTGSSLLFDFRWFSLSYESHSSSLKKQFNTSESLILHGSEMFYIFFSKNRWLLVKSK